MAASLRVLLILMAGMLVTPGYAHQEHDKTGSPQMPADATESAPSAESNPASFEAKSSSPPMEDNTFCPVMPQEPVNPKIFAEINGKRVFFCCQKCRRSFLENPDAFPLASTEVTPPPKPHEMTAESRPDEEKESFIAKALRWLGKWHVVVVHFPIALLLLAAAAEAGGWLGNRPDWMAFSEGAALLGAASAIIASVLGWILAGQIKYGPEAQEILWKHRWLGVATAVLSLAVLLFWWFHLKLAQPGKQRNRERRGYRFALFIAAALVGLTGHFGGSLIYGADYLDFR